MHDRELFLRLRLIVLADEWLSYWTLAALWAAGFPAWILAAAVGLAVFGNAVGYYNLSVAEAVLLPEVGRGSLFRCARAG